MTIDWCAMSTSLKFPMATADTSHGAEFDQYLAASVPSGIDATYQR